MTVPNPFQETVAMVEVTLTCPAIRGKLTIRADENKKGSFVATGKAYEPYELEATTIGHALDETLRSLPNLRYSAETVVRRKARSEMMKKAIANGERKGFGRAKRQSNRAKPVHQHSEDAGNAPPV